MRKQIFQWAQVQHASSCLGFWFHRGLLREDVNQYLDVQAESLGLGDRWEKVKTAYAAANRALGDVVKASKLAASPRLMPWS